MADEEEEESTITVGTNSYITLAEADTFIGLRWYNAIWNTIVNKEQLLVAAYDVLKRFTYVDAPLTETTVDGASTFSASEWIVEAQCLEAVALALLTTDNDFNARLSLQLQGVVEYDVDKIREKFGNRKQIAGLYSKDAFYLISPHIQRFPTKIYGGW